MQTVAAERITELRRRIADANRRYHEEDAPDITDAQYDALVRELEALEREHPESVDADSPTRKVGSAPSGRFAPVRPGSPAEPLPAPSLSGARVRASDQA